MRAIVVIALVLVLSTVAIAAAPTAVACTGDPSVCGVMRDVRCTQREGADAFLGECWTWLV